ncbi:MAG: hypothetical protein QOD75_2321 [Blastocatellia bacterium]|jgi:uncharacterized membrane protein|nr:hypothetical protein [Blastocatellia bacterium]
MRSSLIILVLALALTPLLFGRRKSALALPFARTASAKLDEPNANRAANSTSTATVSQVDFQTQVKPILEARCQGCHFTGGKMYQRLPFDRPETIKTLGEKLFTRLKDEPERRVIRDFLAQ